MGTSDMARIVQKFGGTSVADMARIKAVAATVKRELDDGNEVAVVLSAMAGVTDQLVGYAAEAGGAGYSCGGHQACPSPVRYRSAGQG